MCKMDEVQVIFVCLIIYNLDDYLVIFYLVVLKMRRKKMVDVLEDICIFLKIIGEEKLLSFLLRLIDDDCVCLMCEVYCEGVQRFNIYLGDVLIEGYFLVVIVVFLNKVFEFYIWCVKLYVFKGKFDVVINDLIFVFGKKLNYVEVLCE